MYEKFKAMFDDGTTVRAGDRDHEAGTDTGIAEELFRRERAALHVADGELSWKRFRDLEKQALIEHLVDGAPLQPYLGILSMLRDAGTDRKGMFLGLDHDLEWRAAVRAAVGAPEYLRSIYMHEGDDWRVDGRWRYVAQSLRSLRDHGFSVGLVDGWPRSDAELRNIEIRLLARIEEDPQLHWWMLKELLAARYDVKLDWYRFTRQLSHDKEAGEYPYGHLYLAILAAMSELGSGVTFTRSAAERQRAVETWELYRAFAAVLDVEQWSLYEWMSTDSRDILRELRERVLYEQNFTFRQQTQEQTTTILRLVLQPFADADRFPGLPFSPSEAVGVTTTILSFTTGARGAVFTEADVAERSGVPYETVHRVLDAFALDRGRVEPTSLSMVDLSAGEMMYRPLVRFDGRYLLPDRLVTGPAFYEAVAAAYRGVLGNAFEEVLGKEGLEGAIHALLAEHGIAYYSGGYAGSDLECDAAFESDEAIVFVEAKKKGLTRRSLSGEPEKILLDISASILAAHAQVARHELALRSNGSLTFNDGCVLALNGRKVIRIALTLLDLGSFQDKTVLGKMIHRLMGARLHTTREMSKADQRSVEEFNRVADSLLQSYSALNELDDQWIKRERFRLKGYSLSQLIVLLSDVRSADELVANIGIDDHLTTSTGTGSRSIG
jgi:hypothetical protein